MTGGEQRYLVALGSNMRHPHHGAPRAVVRAAAAELGRRRGFTMIALSPVIDSAPLGPSQRTYANAAALIATSFGPLVVLAELQAIERAFGRRRQGRRWRARVLDLDLVLWSGGAWRSPQLTLPHPRFRHRAFVLGPAARVAPSWRDPLTAHTVAQLAARLTRPRPNPTHGRAGP